MSDTEIVQIIALVTPFAILAVVLLMIPLTRWQDARWDRHEAERKRKAQG
jgi:hypothetical protein